jgi:hypothetical protein
MQQTIKQIDIKRYLLENGIHPAKEYGAYRMYKSPFREEGTPSFKVDYKVNLWYDFGSGEGGSIIDLVMKMKKCSLAQAITLLEEKADFPFRVKTAFPSPAESVERMKLLRTSQFLPLHLANYVLERGISADVAAKFLTAVYYRVNGKEYSALGFKNDAGGYELRNPYFKGCYPPKAITTFDRNSTGCNLFEGFMDFLSYLTLYPIKKENPSPESTVVLNSIHNLEKAVPFLSKQTQIYAYLDNDETGKSALMKLQNLGLPVTDCSKMYAEYKDLNDFLVRLKAPKIQQKISRFKGFRR